MSENTEKLEYDTDPDNFGTQELKSCALGRKIFVDYPDWDKAQEQFDRIPHPQCRAWALYAAMDIAQQAASSKKCRDENFAFRCVFNRDLDKEAAHYNLLHSELVLDCYSQMQGRVCADIKDVDFKDAVLRLVGAIVRAAEYNALTAEEETRKLDSLIRKYPDTEVEIWSQAYLSSENPRRSDGFALKKSLTYYAHNPADPGSFCNLSRQATLSFLKGHLSQKQWKNIIDPLLKKENDDLRLHCLLGCVEARVDIGPYGFHRISRRHRFGLVLQNFFNCGPLYEQALLARQLQALQAKMAAGRQEREAQAAARCVKEKFDRQLAELDTPEDPAPAKTAEPPFA